LEMLFGHQLEREAGEFGALLWPQVVDRLRD
jgi:hypothetical protein